MTASVIPFPPVAWCHYCNQRFRKADLHAHIHECEVRAARMAHPSNRKPDGGGVA